MNERVSVLLLICIVEPSGIDSFSSEQTVVLEWSFCKKLADTHLM